MTSLSNSFIWQNMHEYYDKRGPEVWQDEVVPLHITSNKYLANLYARCIVARINDYRLQDNVITEPFTVIEIGVGHGKFSFYLIKTIVNMLSHFDLPANTIRYIMTDISAPNIASWQAHDALKPFIEQGILDFALYNPLLDNTLDCIQSGQHIKQGDLNMPLFAIGNYLFDTLPHDAFQVHDGKLKVGELKVSDTQRQSADALAACFETEAYDFEWHDTDANYYANHPGINQLLQSYCRQFENASFLIPIGALTCIENVQRFTSNALMFIVADKGDANIQFFDGHHKPEIAYHGSVSMSVNFDAIANYCYLQEGKPLMMDNQNTSFQVAGFTFHNRESIHHSEHEFKTALASFSPQDMFHLCYTEDDDPNLGLETLDELLAIMNLGDWDPALFYDFYPAILSVVEDEEITQEQDAALLNGLPKVWDYYFHLEKTRDIPFAIGCILYQLDYSERALPYFEHSLNYFGYQEETLYNQALALQELDKLDECKQALDKALEINPHYKDAKILAREL